MQIPNIRKVCWAARRKMHPTPPEPPKVPANVVLADLEEPIGAALLSLYGGAPQIGSDGSSYALDQSVRVSPEQGMYIYDLCRTVKPKRTMEIGFAYGFSTLFFLAGHKANGGGRHIAIDPDECSYWHGIGLQKSRDVGLGEWLRWVEDRSILAVAALYREGLRFEVIYVDGNHRFDDVLADFTLCDLVCADGGYIILDDMWMQSIQKVVAFIDRNRPNYIKESTPVGNISVYRKLGPDERDWRHFVDF